MALVTIQEIFHDSTGDLADSGGTLTFTVSNWYAAADGHIVIPKPETATIDGSGAISIALESTTDGNPSSRSYSVQFSGVVDGVQKDLSLGSFNLDPTPSTQNLNDLLVAGLTSETLNTHTDRETPTGAIDGSNKVFTLAATPISGSEHVFQNGMLVLPGGVNYTISGTQITFNIAPMVGEWVRVSYRRA